MDSSDSNDKSESAATLIGRLIGIALVTVTTLLVSSAAFSLGWNHGAARLFGQPDMTWAESLACLVCLWVAASPFRFVRVKMYE